MALTIEQMVTTLNGAGIDTQEKFAGFVAAAAGTLRLAEIDRAVEALRRKQAADHAATETEIQALLTEAAGIREAAGEAILGG